MAKGRMLNRAISTSRKLAELKTDTARLLYTWLLPFLDIEGRFSAEPSVIKGSICPRLKISLKKIETSLKDMEERHLIVMYVVDGDKYLQVRKFEDFQTLRPDRESESNIPPPPGERQENARRTQAQVKLREGKGKLSLSKDKITPPPPIGGKSKSAAADSEDEKQDTFQMPEVVKKELTEHWRFYFQHLGGFNASQWATFVLKMNPSPPADVVGRVLRRMAIGTVAKKIDEAWPWAMKTLSELTKDQRFIETLETHEQQKKAGFSRAGDVLKAITEARSEVQGKTEKGGVPF